MSVCSLSLLESRRSFDFTHGSHPNGPLVQGTDGNFYGTTSGGGTLDGGVVFKLTSAKGHMETASSDGLESIYAVLALTLLLLGVTDSTRPAFLPRERRKRVLQRLRGLQF
jgi:uncharacterized repeat protein (TIGR03803 family)